jgi:multidrug transporter EmrE-like cation transporter
MQVAVGLIAMIAFTVAANLLMKVGAERAASPLLLGVLSWTTIAGLATFGISGLIYAWVLKTLPLNVALSFAAAQYVAVIVASRVVLSEPIPATRWLGIMFIALGILVVALAGGDSRPPAAAAKTTMSVP